MKLRKKGTENIENSLRIFILKVCPEYRIISYMRKSISSRQEEKADKWLSIRRRTNDIFYLDFKELAKVIQNNWTKFQNYVPNIKFITSKINELFDCRNLIVHNSYVTKDI